MAKYNGREVVVTSYDYPEQMVNIDYVGVYADLGSAKVPLGQVRLTADERKLELEQMQKAIVSRQEEFKRQDEEDAKAEAEAEAQKVK